jgi:predicted NUDIX family NTP pyrophosphohydrolase
MPRITAGLIMYRMRKEKLEVLLVHPGGPLCANRDVGAWSIPKGEVKSGEDYLSAAKREFREEVGFPPCGELMALGTLTDKGGNRIQAWAFQGTSNPAWVSSNTFTMEWPLGSGRVQEFPEVDRAQFFTIEVAQQKISPAQAAFLHKLERALDRRKQKRRSRCVNSSV